MSAGGLGLSMVEAGVAEAVSVAEPDALPSLTVGAAGPAV
jgi:hypothetical protein